MPSRKTNDPNETSQAVLVRPLTETEPVKSRGAGRPARLTMPDLPKMPMTEPEQALFDYFMDAYKQQYPDMVPTDLLILHLAALEYIKYLRVVAEELETGKVISMARQHPGVNMRALLDQLSVTRKARTQGKKEEDPDARELREFFMGMSNTKRGR
jgi:hypothetical protein